MHEARVAVMRLIAPAALLALAGAAEAQDTLVVSWWGYNGDKLQANVIDPFQAICDCEVVFETGNNADRLN
jgi:putative spermidine/putrescine transport system substrate-binding protein